MRASNNVKKTKRCKECGCDKPLKEYYIRHDPIKRYDPRCKSCCQFRMKDNRRLRAGITHKRKYKNTLEENVAVMTPWPELLDMYWRQPRKERDPSNGRHWM